jgi:murein DD-endopeptidase MepM/ murein hydrolase activator NlpD
MMFDGWLDTYTDSLGNSDLVMVAADGSGNRFDHLHVNEIVNPRRNCKQGEIVGYTGNTGNSTGAHDHITYRPNWVAQPRGFVDCQDMLANAPIWAEKLAAATAALPVEVTPTTQTTTVPTVAVETVKQPMQVVSQPIKTPTPLIINSTTMQPLIDALVTLLSKVQDYASRKFALAILAISGFDGALFYLVKNNIVVDAGDIKTFSVIAGLVTIAIVGAYYVSNLADKPPTP